MENNHKTQSLPATIRTFLDAQEVRDPEAALALFVEGAVISDVGESFAGGEGIRRFIVEAGAEFTLTTEITDVRQDGPVWVVSEHLEGDFPGGKADLDYRFTLEGDRISRLDIVLG
ncbi:hypothetical protein SAMN04489867_2119 [Pedococcus dokdonensis]|uniref:SnoaL-like domain-containing protein n=1 Tax=Pedococcus dokdonensis TaxID=443156 RepID=A0A1H0RX14_9MICO|nr:nuclear transport factor 2 family protein [Pedococcus dokdonensis]SDP33970.1 hypothetical protein SAMN04489867_2119 [Pedococcus dokdonensis]